MKHKLLALLLCLPLLSASNGPQMVRPEYLKPGDKVALLAPAYNMKDPLVDKAMAAIREAGLVPVEGASLRKRYPNKDAYEAYAGTPEQRAADILRALRDPEIKAIICARGGYGSIQTLPYLNESDVRKAGKWLVGYSDMTVLQTLWTKAGVMSIHGPMGKSFALNGASDPDNAELVSMLMGQIPSYDVKPSSHNSYGKARGTLVGGNMISFVSMLGTDYDCLQGRDCILFLEETDESIHAIDRQFNLLLLSGRMQNVKGIIIGSITKCRNDQGQASPEAMLAKYTKKLGIPVCYGFPNGHGDRCRPLMLGAEVCLEVGPDSVTLKYE